MFDRDDHSTLRRVLVLDAHETVQCGVRFAVIRHGLARRCIGCASLPLAIAATCRYEPHIAIVGAVPGVGQAHAVDALRRARPSLLFVALGDPRSELPPVQARLPPTASLRELISVLRSLQPAAPAPPSPRRPDSLSSRQREVLSALASGMTNAEIAASLGVSPETVKWHVRSLCRRLGARNRAEAVAKGHRLHQPLARVS